MTDLKPCPFCGGDASASQNENLTLWGAYCLDCPAELLDFKTEEAAIAAWNRRASQPAPEGFIGASVGADFDTNTWTFEMQPGYQVGAGHYLITKCAAPTVQERTIRTHRERDQAAAIEQQRESQGDL